MKPKIYGLASLTELVTPKGQKRKSGKTIKAKIEKMPAFDRAVRSATKEWNKLTPDQRNGFV